MQRDFNAKYTLWGSRIKTPRGRTLEKYIRTSNHNILFTERPTYWPTDLNKTPDLLDFTVIKGLNANKLKITPSLMLSSDHIPIIIEYTNKPILYKIQIRIVLRLLLGQPRRTDVSRRSSSPGISE